MLHLSQKSKHKPELKGQDFLTLAHFSPEEIEYILNEALELKKEHQLGMQQDYLKGKVLAMIFEKPSTRTRISFEVGMLQLGGHAIYLNKNDIQLGRGESYADTAQVLSRYADGVMIRTFSHQTLEQFAAHAQIPVINGLTDLHHPAQVLADLLTIIEKKGRLEGLKIAYLGDGANNMAHSWIEGAMLTGMNISIACPQGYEPKREIVNNVKMKVLQKLTNATLSITEHPVEAVDNADIIVTDVWSSMGHEQEERIRKQQMHPYQVNETLCKKAKDDFLFLHCLPAHRQEEVTAPILEGSHSVVFDEAENRLHAQKAILKLLMSKHSSVR